ncbi:MAG: T9SS type A sorting domain-containing protein [Bacteroidota bacterium]
MKNYIKILFTGLFLISIHITVRAQAQLGLYTTSVSSSTPNMGDQLYLFAQLKNYSTIDTFNGVINFELANKDSIITNVTIVGKPPYTNTVIKLAPLEEKSALFTVQILPSYFKAGPDIIIVWPIATATIVDSASAVIVIQDPLSIDEQTKAKLRIFTTTEQLIIINEGQESQLEQVRIYTTTGSVILAYKTNTPNITIPLSVLPQGSYIAEVLLQNGERRMLKFAK